MVTSCFGIRPTCASCASDQGYARKLQAHASLRHAIVGVVGCGHAHIDNEGR